MARITLSISDELRDRLDKEVKRRNNARGEYAAKVSRSLVVCAMIDAALAEGAAKCDEVDTPLEDAVQAEISEWVMSYSVVTLETSKQMLLYGFISLIDSLNEEAEANRWRTCRHDDIWRARELSAMSALVVLMVARYYAEHESDHRTRRPASRRINSSPPSILNSSIRRWLRSQPQLAFDVQSALHIGEE